MAGWSRHGLRRRAGRALAALGCGLAIVVGSASAAPAHAELVRSDPSAGGTAAVGRTAMTLWFTEAVELGPADVRLTTLDGREVLVTVASSEDAVIGLATPPLSRATYVLDWHAVSLDDGHSSAGSVLFGVGVRPAAASPGSSGRTAPDAVALRWLDLSALVLVGGSLAVSRRAQRSAGAFPAGTRRRSELVGACAAVVAVVTGAMTPVLVTRSGAESLGARVHTVADLLTGSAWGHLWMARGAALVVVALALLRDAGPGEQARAGRRRWAMAVVALVGALWCDASAGHAASIPARSGLAALATAGHVAAASVWVGGLAVLAGCLAPELWRSTGQRVALLAAALRAFSPVAAVAAAVVLATGVYAAAREVPDLHALTGTVYGGAVLAKVALVALALALATANTLLVRGPLAGRVARALRRPVGWAPLPPRRLPALVAAEVAVLAVAVAVAALLTSVPTAREATVTEQLRYLHTAQVDGLFITLEDVPAGTVSSRLVVRTRATVRPEVAPVDAVEVLLAGPAGESHVPLAPVEPGRWDAPAPALAPGSWTVSVAIQRGDLPISTTQVRWVVAAPPGDGVGPLEAAAAGLAIVLLVGTAVGVGLARRRDEPSELPAPPVVSGRVS
ncbi:copper resistance protein CopC [Xylanimonas sp. McL0601]|uniref:copper resistance CopC/CopD family protein n=1 Tax=Xylanimonas sp. McL0601 TaxID=3414739 RepID=UPI003CEC8F01